MNYNRDPTNTDEYFVMARQIFDGCGVESSGSIRVDALMDRFAPYEKTNKAEFSFLKTLLDPEENNPDINVTKLAKALHKYSENQKTKVDLDESFNLRTGQAPQDSDSGISTDGLLEELQCELKVKMHLTEQLRSQLDFTDRQHEEAIAGLTAERDSLLRHLNMVRDENAILSNVRQDYDEACERLCASETALEKATRELDSYKKRAKVYQDQLAALETEKLTLQELLSKSKDECHRINEMYATRQSALLEENENFKAENAELTSRFHDQDEYLQHLLKQNLTLEMELKDVLNKSNQTPLRLDRSIDVSYTEEQMLTALDSLNADSRFAPEHRILDEESFLSALKEDQGRSTNLSLFDELRLSICNMTRFNISEANSDKLDCSLFSHALGPFGTQNDEVEFHDDEAASTETDVIKAHSSSSKVSSTQTDENDDKVADFFIDKPVKNNNVPILCDMAPKLLVAVETQTDNESKPCDKGNKEDNHSVIVVGDWMCEKIAKTVETQTNSGENLLSLHINKDGNNIKQVSTATQTLGSFLRRPFVINRRVPCPKPQLNKIAVETQTDSDMLSINNNAHGYNCLECETANKYTAKLERDVKYSNLVVTEVQNEIAKYEENLEFLQRLIDEGNRKNKILEHVIKDLNAKIEILERATEMQREVLNNIVTPEVCCVDCQTDCDQSSVCTQVEVPCAECEKRNAVVPFGSVRRFFWESLKCLFQLFAVICFIGAVCVLCGVVRAGAGGAGGGGCRVAPWRWLHAQDIMDLLLRIEYTAEVPM